jgi:hypothetical protein
MGWNDVMNMSDRERLWFYKKAKKIAQKEKEEINKSKSNV